MKIYLVDRNKEMCDEWNRQFKDCLDVFVHHGNYFDYLSDCVVSPSNSYGFLDGGLDNEIRKFYEKEHHIDIEKTVQDAIYLRFDGELLVGQCLFFPLITFNQSKRVPDLLVAPTMRVPMILGKESVNVYLSGKAIFKKLKELDRINRVSSITISGLGTGIGRVPYDVCAKQMKQAYEDVWLSKGKFPRTWSEAQINHQLLYDEDYIDLQNKK
jgi:O-acetyl-ADP-ribose deacetylase (regulator of RNase III)